VHCPPDYRYAAAGICELNKIHREAGDAEIALQLRQQQYPDVRFVVHHKYKKAHV